MKPAGLPLVAWGAFVALLGVGLLAWSGTLAGPWLLLASSGRAQISTNLIDIDATPLHDVVAEVVRLAGERGVEVAGGELVGLLLPDADRRRAVPDISLSPTVMAGGVLVLLVAVAAGRWLVLLGLGVIALGAGGLVRELRAQRRELR